MKKTYVSPEVELIDLMATQSIASHPDDTDRTRSGVSGDGVLTGSPVIGDGSGMTP